MITGQHDQLFPSIAKLGKWYEDQLIVVTTYVKVLVRHFNIKNVDLSLMQKAALYQLNIKTIKKQGDTIPSQLEFSICKKAASIPHIEIVEVPDLSVVGENKEEPLLLDEDDFDYDEKITKEELSLLSAHNVKSSYDEKEKKEEDKNAPMSIVTLAKFYETKIDLMAKIAKAMLISAKCSKITVPWDFIERSALTQIHVNYNILENNEVEGVSVRLSDGQGRTTYGFFKVEKKKKQSHLKLIT